ncbi:hypothetical protein M758_5G144400 [Ceratodon purpureus]|nr:hypothetical protein M758_5G144400 [Ceratodon purpureus]
MALSRSCSARMLTSLTFLLAALVSTSHAARLTAAFQHNFDSQSNSEMIRAELMHRDHPDSPLASAEGTTLAQRWEAAVNRSDNQIAARGRRLADFQTPVTRIGGFSGEYIMSIAFGTPPQRFVGLVDTGSDLVWVQCVKCPGCTNFVQPDPFYDPTISSSDEYIGCSDKQCSVFESPPLCSTTKTCRIDYGYVDGSFVSGTLTTETITLSNTAGANPVASGFVMGCMNNNSETGFDNFDGIIGFGRGTFSLPSQFSTIAYLRVFSYCLVPFAATTTQTSSMLFGTSDPANALGLVYTPLLDIGTTNYYVNMTGISLNGEPLDILPSAFQYIKSTDSGGVIFDSGNTVTRFGPDVYDTLRQAVSNLITYPEVTQSNLDRYCFDITGVQTPMYPKVTLHFGGMDGSSVVDFDLGDENSFGPYSGDEGVSCLAFRKSGSEESSIGGLQQANHYIETDVEKMRMGWVTKDCSLI